GTAVAAPAITLVANAEGEAPVIAPNTWVEIKGSNLAPAGDTRAWETSDFFASQMTTQLGEGSGTVKRRSAYVYFVSTGQTNIRTPPDPMQGAVRVQVTVAGIAGAPVSVEAQPLAPSFFVFNGGPQVAAEHSDGTLLGAASLFPGL